MKSVVGIYQTHQDAVDAVSRLQKEDYPIKHISLLAKADLVDNHVTVRSSDTPEKAEVSIGVVAGTVLGVLTGVGILALPGLGFLFGAGALVGGFAGFDLGIIGGGLAAILTSMGMNEVLSARYEKHLNEGKFLVFVQGSEDELDKAQHILHTSGLHMELDRN
jgi:hypothetical protein